MNTPLHLWCEPDDVQSMATDLRAFAPPKTQTPLTTGFGQSRGITHLATREVQQPDHPVLLQIESGHLLGLSRSVFLLQFRCRGQGLSLTCLILARE